MNERRLRVIEGGGDPDAEQRVFHTERPGGDLEDGIVYGQGTGNHIEMEPPVIVRSYREFVNIFGENPWDELRLRMEPAVDPDSAERRAKWSQRRSEHRREAWEGRRAAHLRRLSAFVFLALAGLCFLAGELTKSDPNDLFVLAAMGLIVPLLAEIWYA